MQTARRACPRIALVVIVLSACPLTGAEPPARPKREPIGEVLGKPVYRDELHPRYPSPTEEDELHRLFLDPVLEKYVTAHRAELLPAQAELVAVEALLEKKPTAERESAVAEIRKSLRLVDEELHKQHSEFERDYLLQKRQDMEERLKAELAAKPDDRLEGNPFVDELKRVKADLARPGLTKQERESLEEAKRDCESRLAHPYRMTAAFLYGNWKLQRHFYDHFGGGRVLWQQAGYEAFDAYRRWLETEERQGHFKITDPKLRQAFYRYWRQSNSPYLIKDADRIRAEFLEPDWVPKPNQR
jgi:hypothetical protein